MEKLVFHKMTDDMYIGIITVLDYEISLKKCLSELIFPPTDGNERKVIVDLALKTGINQYRFAVFDVGEDGKITWNNSKYIFPNIKMIYIADNYLKEQGDVIEHSILPGAKKRELMA